MIYFSSQRLLSLALIGPFTNSITFVNKVFTSDEHVPNIHLFFPHLGFNLEMISIVPARTVFEDTVKVSFILDVREHSL